MDMAVDAIRTDIREAAMTTYEQIKQEGRVEAGAAILARLLAKRFRVDPVPILPLLSSLDFAQVQELSEKILEVENMDEIRRWLETVRHN
jgi:hypothetical protein